MTEMQFPNPMLTLTPDIIKTEVGLAIFISCLRTEAHKTCSLLCRKVTDTPRMRKISA